MLVMFAGKFVQKRVFVTGHTGFKGAWLTHWLLRLGAEVTGYALDASTQPNLFTASGLEEHIHHYSGDIRDSTALERAVHDAQPDYLFHLAAQPLVLQSYRLPKETFEINVIGTLSVLEAVRTLPKRCVVIVVATDKVYENREWVYGYREIDPLGGFDPYSASKAAMEIAVSSYRRSFFSADDRIRLASVRSGNVIGGGDWSDNRVIPDAVRALAQREPIRIRNPRSIRPWQHVLEALSGYLWLAAVLNNDQWTSFADAWNFGPTIDGEHTVAEMVNAFITAWGSGQWIDVSSADMPHEAELLRLNTDKTQSKLGWRSVWDFTTTIQRTAQWYRAFLDTRDTPHEVRALCLSDISAYEQSATNRQALWTS